MTKLWIKQVYAEIFKFHSESIEIPEDAEEAIKYLISKISLGKSAVRPEVVLQHYRDGKTYSELASMLNDLPKMAGRSTPFRH